MTIVHPLTGRVLLTAIALSACSPSGEVTQPEVKPIELGDADLRDMVLDHRVTAEPQCLYVADAKQDQIHCVDLKTRAQDTSATVNLTRGTMPVALALSRVGKKLYFRSVSTTSSKTLYEADIENPKMSSVKLLQPPYQQKLDALAVHSNDRVAVGLQASETMPAKIDYYNPPIGNIRPLAPETAPNSRIVCVNDDGTLFVTAEVTNDSPVVTLWRTGVSNTAQLASGQYFGSLMQNNPSIVFHPDQSGFYVLTDGDGAGSRIPVYRITDSGVVAGGVRLDADYPAVALAFTANLRRVLVAHDAEVRNGYPFAPDHDLSVPDLHVFDAATGTPVGVIALPDHVRDRGITVAPDGSIYVLLGRDKESRLVVISDPGN